MSTRRLLGWAALVVLATACRTRSTMQPVRTVPNAVGGGAPVEPEHSDSDMFVEHFARTLRMREAVIHGDLDSFRKASRALARHDMHASFPERWKPFIDELRDTANVGAGAATPDAAAKVVARLATTCGDCHRVLGGGPKLAIGEAPVQFAGEKSQMKLHAWGADRMWLGLVQPSDEAWKKGSEAIAWATIVGPDGASHADLSARVHALGELGRTQVGPAKPPAPPNAPRRTDTYAELLTTCASCHASAKK